MLTNCLAECAHNYNRFSDRARYWSKIVIFSYPLAFDAPVKGVSVGTSPSHLARKNWNGLATRWWKNFEDTFICFGATHERDRQTDGRTDTTCPHIPRLCIASRGKNRHFYVPRPSFFVCPGDAPGAITQNLAQMKRQFSDCQTPRSMYLSIFNSFRVIRCLSQCVSRKNRHFYHIFPLGTPLEQSR